MKARKSNPEFSKQIKTLLGYLHGVFFHIFHSSMSRNRFLKIPCTTVKHCSLVTYLDLVVLYFLYIYSFFMQIFPVCECPIYPALDKFVIQLFGFEATYKFLIRGSWLTGELKKEGQWHAIIPACLEANKHFECYQRIPRAIQYDRWTFKHSHFESGLSSKVQDNSTQNGDVSVLTRARSSQPFFRSKHQSLYCDSTQLWITEFVWRPQGMCVDLKLLLASAQQCFCCQNFTNDFLDILSL